MSKTEEELERERIDTTKESMGYKSWTEAICDNCKFMQYQRNKEESNSNQQFCLTGEFWTHGDATCEEFQKEE